MTVIIFCKATITELVLGKQRNGKANKKKAACASQRKYFCGKEISHHRVLIICLLFSPQTCVIACTGVCLCFCVRAAALLPNPPCHTAIVASSVGVKCFVTRVHIGYHGYHMRALWLDVYLKLRQVYSRGSKKADIPPSSFGLAHKKSSNITKILKPT